MIKDIITSENKINLIKTDKLSVVPGGSVGFEIKKEIRSSYAIYTDGYVALCYL